MMEHNEKCPHFSFAQSTKNALIPSFIFLQNFPFVSWLRLSKMKMIESEGKRKKKK